MFVVIDARLHTGSDVPLTQPVDFFLIKAFTLFLSSFCKLSQIFCGLIHLVNYDFLFSINPITISIKYNFLTVIM